MSHPDTERKTLGFSNSELRGAIERPSRQLSSAQAARGLLSRERLRPVAAAQLILNANSALDSKIAAIHALGRTRQRGAQDLLVETLKSPDISILRAGVWSLAKSGDREALEQLKRVDTSRRPAIKNTLAAAQRLLAFRLGVTGFGFDARTLPSPVPLPRDKLREMKIGRIDGERLEKLQRKIDADAPGLNLRIGPATEVICLSKPLWLIPSKQVIEQPHDLEEKPSVPMAIFSYDGCTAAPYLKAYVMSEPTLSGIALYVTRLRGQVTHRGQIQLERGGASFKLNALDTRYDPAAAMEGTLGRDGIIKVESAVVTESFARQAELRRKPRESAPAPAGPADSSIGLNR